MLKFYDIEQNTDEWLEARCGLLTSSNMSSVMAKPKSFTDKKPTWAFSEGAKKLAVKIALEQLTGNVTTDGFSNESTDRGHVFEPIAIDVYESRNFVEVQHGGFFCDDRLGASPDRRVYGNTIEVKTRLPLIHFNNIKRGGLEPISKWQCISNVHLTGSEWLDYCSYNPAFPDGKDLFVFRVWHEEYKEDIATMMNRIDEFLEYVEKIKKTITGGNNG